MTVLTAPQLVDLVGAEADQELVVQLTELHDALTDADQEVYVLDLLRQAQHLSTLPRPVPYVHPLRPWPDPRPLPSGMDERPPFGVATVAWLDRLPRSAPQIGAADVVTLGQLAVEAQPDSDDELLIRRILAPIERLHDQRAADSALAVHDAIHHTGPPWNAVTVIAGALRREDDQLSKADSEAEATRMIREREEAVQSQHQTDREQLLAARSAGTGAVA